MKYRILVCIAVSVLSGCATMDSDLSCNVTASDSCMTISQVDNMSESKFQVNKRRTNHGYKGSKEVDRKTLGDQSILISPWIDESGQSHSGENVHLSLNDEVLS